MPLISAATESGIISWLGAVPVLWAMRSATGMKMATTPVELMNAPSIATAAMSQTSRRVSLLPALLEEPVAEPLGHARPYQAIADDEQGSDQDDVRIAEASQRLAHADDAGEGQRRQHDQRHGVHAGLVDREHRDRGREQNEYHHKISGHVLSTANPGIANLLPEL